MASMKSLNGHFLLCPVCLRTQETLSVHLRQTCMNTYTEAEITKALDKAKEDVIDLLQNKRTFSYGVLHSIVTSSNPLERLIEELKRHHLVVTGIPTPLPVPSTIKQEESDQSLPLPSSIKQEEPEQSLPAPSTIKQEESDYSSEESDLSGVTSDSSGERLFQRDQLDRLRRMGQVSGYNRRTCSQETGVLQQGIPPPEAPVAAPVNVQSVAAPLNVQSVNQREAVVSAAVASPFVFVLPQNTTGTAVLKPRLNFGSAAPSVSRPTATAVQRRPTVTAAATTIAAQHHRAVTAATTTEAAAATQHHLTAAATTIAAQHHLTAAATTIAAQHPRAVTAATTAAATAQRRPVSTIFPAHPTPTGVLPVPPPHQPTGHYVPILPASGDIQVVPPRVPYTTRVYRRRKMARESAGMYSRKYERKTDVVLCKSCQKDRKTPGHQQYFGNWFCQETSNESLAEWRERLTAKGYGKKKE